MNRLQKILISIPLIAVVGCAAAPYGPQYDPTYISPTMYKDYNCKQIRAEMRRISAKLEQSNQADAAGNILGAAVMAYGISQGYAMYGGEEDATAQRLSNQYDVLEQTAIKKNCN